MPRIKGLNDNPEWSGRIKALRQELGFSMRGLSIKMDLSPKTVENWEKGFCPALGIQKLYEKELERMLEAKQAEAQK